MNFLKASKLLHLKVQQCSVEKTVAKTSKCDGLEGSRISKIHRLINKIILPLNHQKVLGCGELEDRYDPLKSSSFYLLSCVFVT